MFAWLRRLTMRQHWHWQPTDDAVAGHIRPAFEVASNESEPWSGAEAWIDADARSAKPPMGTATLVADDALTIIDAMQQVIVSITSDNDHRERLLFEGLFPSGFVALTQTPHADPFARQTLYRTGLDFALISDPLTRPAATRLSPRQRRDRFARLRQLTTFAPLATDVLATQQPGRSTKPVAEHLDVSDEVGVDDRLAVRRLVRLMADLGHDFIDDQTTRADACNLMGDWLTLAGMHRLVVYGDKTLMRQASDALQHHLLHLGATDAQQRRPDFLIAGHVTELPHAWFVEQYRLSTSIVAHR